MIRVCLPSDAVEVCRIYNHYVLHSIITFEAVPVTAEEMARRIDEVSAKQPWLVWEQDGEIAGYAYATSWKPRFAYRYSVESSVYLAPDKTGQGIGFQLYSELIRLLKLNNVHNIIGGIALPNESSVKVHERCGFKKIGHFSEVGFKFDKWIDVGYWELLVD